MVSALKSDAADESDDQAASLLPSFSQFDAEVPYRFRLSSRVQLTSANAKSLGLIGTSFLADATVNFSLDCRFDFDNSDGVRREAVDFETAAEEPLLIIAYDSESKYVHKRFQIQVLDIVETPPLPVHVLQRGTPLIG